MSREPHDLMSKNYCGPSKVIPLEQIPNTEGFKFIGIDKDGGKHDCIVQRWYDGLFYMSSDTVTFEQLMGWIPFTSIASLCE